MLRYLVVGIGAIVAMMAMGAARGKGAAPDETLVAAGSVGKDCRFKGKKLSGKVQVVKSFPDFKVQKVSSFPDLKVQTVKSFPDACGKWQFVESFPDFKIQFVDNFPDFKIQLVDNFPGVP
jgi:hypothetical protein